MVVAAVAAADALLFYLQREDPDLFDSILEFLLRLHQLSLQLSHLSFHDEWSGCTVDKNNAPLPCNTFFSAVRYLEPTRVR